MYTNAKVLLLCGLLYIAPSAKILIVVEQGYYNAFGAKVEQYATDIRQYDFKTVDVVSYAPGAGGNVQLCRNLWLLLESRYSQAKSTWDELEGAVLIGNLPAPMYAYNVGGAIPSTEPCDYYYQDVWNSNTNAAYANHDITAWHTAIYGGTEYFDGYNWGAGDNRFDLWISRIIGNNIRNLRGKDGVTVLQEYNIYNEYLDRVHAWMAEPATVPHRGFALGDITDFPNATLDHLSIRNLQLPFYVEFRNPNNNPSNWQSQLQAGPLGNINLGAFNYSRFPDERNHRECRWASLTDAVTGQVYNHLDNLGYEWAGIFEHSNEYLNTFNYVHFADGANGSTGAPNGGFWSATLGPFCGNNNIRAGGYNGDYYFYNTDNSPQPWLFPNWDYHWNGWTFEWQMIVPATGQYDILLSWDARSTNAGIDPNNPGVYVYEIAVDAQGNRVGAALQTTPRIKIDQRSHTNLVYPNWERVSTGLNLTAGNMVVVVLDANGNAGGDIIADAAWIHGTNPPGWELYVDNRDIGFRMSGWNDRSYESMQDEAADHKAFSKTPFYITNACHINNYTNVTLDNLGNLYALGHNGLICMGTSDNNWVGRDYNFFMNSLKAGQDFGQAMMNQSNTYFSFDGMYCLLGAGNLRARYIPYGTEIVQNQTISTAIQKTSANPLLLRGITVTSSGNYQVHSTGTNSEIIVRPETNFQLGSEVRLYVN